MRLPETDRTRLMDAILRDKYGDGLAGHVARMRNNGLGARPIADRLVHLTGVQVSFRSVARWLKESDLAEREAA